MLSVANICNAMPHWRRLDKQLIDWAFALARLSAGSSIAARMAMMAITTSSSIKVKAICLLEFPFISTIKVIMLTHRCYHSLPHRQAVKQEQLDERRPGPVEPGAAVSRKNGPLIKDLRFCRIGPSRPWACCQIRPYS